MLHQKRGSIRSVDLAGYMGYSKPSVSHAVKNLRTGGFLVIDENGCLCLRACLISSDEDGNEGESKNLSRNNEFTLTIFPKPAEFIQPAEKALYHPTTRQHNKSV